MHTATPCRPAFTLVEILIVVVILGVLASIVLPRIADATTASTQTAFVTDLANYNKAAHVFIAEQARFFEDSSTGDVPIGFEDYIYAAGWTDGTPIGGSWDAEFGSYGVTSAIGVHFDVVADARDDAYMTEIDAMLDDGDLSSGAFRKLDNQRYYMILAR